MELISVVIPVYNQARYLERAIRSCLRQSYQAIEVLVVDDGSTDESAAVANAFEDDRLRYIYQPNAGLSAARNNGIKSTKGELLSFLDSDDEFLPDKFEILLEEFQRESELGLVAGQAIPVDEYGQELGRVFDKPTPTDPADWLLGNPLHVGSVLLRREWQERAGLFDEDLKSYEDWDMWLRLAILGCPMCWVDKPVSLYRFHSQQMIRDGSRMTRANFLVLEKVFKRDDIPESWRLRKDRAFSHAHLRAAANEYLVKNSKEGKQHLINAVRLNEELELDQARRLQDHLSRWADLPKADDPVRFILYIFSNLPDVIRSSLDRRHGLSEVLLGMTFRAYGSGNYEQANSACLAAVRTRPQNLFNRGVLAILVKSTFKRKKQSQG